MLLSRLSSTDVAVFVNLAAYLALVVPTTIFRKLLWFDCLAKLVKSNET